METRANYILVGVFTLAALLAAFLFVYWTAQFGGTEETAPIRIRISGSAAGLGQGSLVSFNGVRIGDVRSVNFDPENPGIAVANARVIRNAPITPSTRASIGIQGLTGQAYIEFTGGDPKERNVFDTADETGDTAIITADPSAVTNILETVQSIAVRADNILDDFEQVVADARDPLTQSVNNIQKFSQALSDNSDAIDDFLANFTTLSKQLGEASGKLGTTLDSANQLITSLDRDKINDTIANVQSFTDRLEKSGGNIDSIVKGVDTAVKDIQSFASSATKTADRIDQLLGDISREKINQTVDNVASASQSAKSAADEAAKLVSRFGARGDDIDATIKNARELSEKLNAASERIDGMLAKVDGLLGEEGGGDLIADARETLKSFRRTADNLNQRLDGILQKVDGLLGDGGGDLVGEARNTLSSFREVANNLNARIDNISGGLEKFSGRGLDEVQSLVRDSRRSIQRIERAISDLERNPQRIITGGEGTVRQYDGRARR